MRIVNLKQGSPEWLIWRREGVSASDAAVLLCMSTYKTVWRLWAEKSGLAIEADLSANPLVQHGLVFEGVARMKLEKLLQDMLIPFCVESTVNPLLRASLDGLTARGEPVEIKCPSQAVFDDVVAHKAGSEAFKLYYPQVQHQLLVTGAKKGYLAFYCNDQIEVFVISQDELMHERLKRDSVKLFEMVAARKEPVKDPARDLYIPKGSDVTKWVCSAQEFKALDVQVQALTMKLDELKAAQKNARQAMQDMMGDFMHADYCGVMVTRYKASGKVDLERLMAEKNGSFTQADVDAYRRPESWRCRVTLTNDLAPRSFVGDEVVSPVHKALQAMSQPVI
ncbi:YqaJ viral recombinase family protein [Comamonas jiangduensis]|uniref:YqaJ viral recombinase family nuclease n=1 Tax=Comamonas jiangduensis TaxID=1194168 RepID=UPI003BF83297